MGSKIQPASFHFLLHPSSWVCKIDTTEEANGRAPASVSKQFSMVPESSAESTGLPRYFVSTTSPTSWKGHGATEENGARCCTTSENKVDDKRMSVCGIQEGSKWDSIQTSKLSFKPSGFLVRRHIGIYPRHITLLPVASRDKRHHYTAIEIEERSYPLQCCGAFSLLQLL
jgi:hypothetical protein